MRIARRAGMNKAKVALARKLAVIMLACSKDNVPFNPAAKAAARLTKEHQPVFGRATTPAFPKRSPFAGTMDQVRPPSGLSTHPHVITLP